MAAAPEYPPLEDRPLKDTICLFDVDGTLTPSRLVRFINYLFEKLVIPPSLYNPCPSTSPIEQKAESYLHHQPFKQS